MLEVLEQAGLVETDVNEDGKDAMRLTEDGERVARQMAMSGRPPRCARRGRAGVITLLILLLLTVVGAVSPVAASLLVTLVLTRLP